MHTSSPYQLFTVCLWMIIVGLTSKVIADHSKVLYLNEGRTQSVSCAALMDTRLMAEGIFYFGWSAPETVNLFEQGPPIKYELSNVSTIAVRDYSKMTSESERKSWVESTPEGVLVFHSPKTSFNGQYVCRFYSSEGHVLGVYPLSVRIRISNDIQDSDIESKQDSGIDSQTKVKIGFISAVVVVVGILFASCVWRHYRKRRKKRNSKKDFKPLQNEGLTSIPTIIVLNVHGEEEQIL